MAITLHGAQLGFYDLGEFASFREIHKDAYYLICSSMEHRTNGCADGDLFVSNTLLAAVLSPFLWVHEWAQHSSMPDNTIRLFYDAVMRDRYEHWCAVQVWDIDAYVQKLLFGAETTKPEVTREDEILKRIAVFPFFCSMIAEKKYRVMLVSAPNSLRDNKGEAIASTRLVTHNQLLAENIMELYINLREFDWRLELSEGSGVMDFDALFQQYRKEGKLDEALDEIVKCLEDIIKMGGDELRKKVVDDLTEIVAGASKAKSGSRTAIESILCVISEFMKTLLAQSPELRAISAVISALTALDGWMQTAGKELRVIDEKVCERINKALKSGQVSGPLLTYTPHGDILSTDAPREDGIDSRA